MDNFKQAIVGLPEQFGEGVKAAKDKKIDAEYQRIVICGMGGSGLPGELLKMVACHLNFAVHKNYAPQLFTESPLVVAISYSGNTEETLSCAKQALNQNRPLACITTGGKLEKLAAKSSSCLIKIPQTGIQPRWATGYLLSALLTFLENLELTEGNINACRRIAERTSPKKHSKKGEKLAEAVDKKTPLIYSSTKNAPLAYYWKIAFNENGKVQAFCNHFPELNHNEMQALEDENKNFHIILLEDKTDAERIKKRMQVFAQLAQKQNFDVSRVKLEAEYPLEKITDAIILANWTVYYFCQQHNIDPEPVKLVEEFKQKIST